MNNFEGKKRWFPKCPLHTHIHIYKASFCFCFFSIFSRWLFVAFAFVLFWFVCSTLITLQKKKEKITNWIIRVNTFYMCWAFGWDGDAGFNTYTCIYRIYGQRYTYRFIFSFFCLFGMSFYQYGKKSWITFNKIPFLCFCLSSFFFT